MGKDKPCVGENWLHIWRKMKMVHNGTKSLGHSKNSSKREVHSNTGIP